MNTTKEKFNNLYNNNFALFITLFIIIVIVLICVIIGFSKLTNSIRRNESFIPAPSFKKGTAQKQGTIKQTEQDILKGMPIQIDDQFGSQLTNIQNDFNSVQQSGVATTRNVANQTTFNNIEGIVDQNLATKGYMNERDAKAKEAALIYVWDKQEIPDTFDSIIFNPYTGPSFASGQSGLYAGIQELENRADRIQQVQSKGVAYKNQQWNNNLRDQQQTIFNELKSSVMQQQAQV